MAPTRHFFGASHEEFAQNAIIGSDLQNNASGDPLRAIELYGERVLPMPRGARV